LDGVSDPAATQTDRSVLRDPTRRAAVLALASVLALDGADRTALGAVTPALKAEFGIGNGAIGLLAGAFAIVGALATVPIGILTDRVRRITILVVCIGIWCVGMGAAAAAQTFAMLFVARISLGVLSAAGEPPVSSIVGDLFPADVRGRVLGFIESGALVGAGIGFLVAGGVLWFASWRGVFVVLALVGVLLGIYVARVPEPRRGGEDDAVVGVADSGEPTQLAQLVEERGVEPAEDLVLGGDQSDLPIVPAVTYVLRVRTVAMSIIAAALGDIFLVALQVFGVLYLVDQFGLSASQASFLIPVVGVGGFVGILAGGRVGDALVEHGVLAGRLHVGVWSNLLAAVFMTPVFLVSSLAVALPFLVLACAFLTAPVAALDAARLDVVHPQLRGRAEGIRVIARVAAQAAAPVVIGVLSMDLGGGGAEGLRLAFLLLLPLLALSSVFLMIGARHYPNEVAAVEQSEVVDDA
jgi:MFS family permease